MNGSERLVAAVWTRDTLRWDIDYDLAAEQLPSQEAAAFRDGLVPEDVAGYAAADKGTSYSLLWCERVSEEEQRCVVADISRSGPRTWDSGTRDFPDHMLTLQSYLSHDGIRRYATVAGDASNGWLHAAAMYAVSDSLEISSSSQTNYVQTDISIASSGGLPDPLVSYRRQLDA